MVAVEHHGLDELAETGNAAVLHVSPCPGPREPARDQEPDVASTEDHQELLGHRLEGATEGSEQGRGDVKHHFLPASRTVQLCQEQDSSQKHR